MTLEFEKLTDAVADMVLQVGQRRRRQQEQLAEALDLLNDHANAWDEIESALALAVTLADEKFYRSARPLREQQPLNVGRPPGACPAQATIIASDGSQIVPDRHAPFLYYLINVGVMVYHHGSGRPPDIFTVPQLNYPRDDALEEEDTFALGSALVSLWRDRAEIETLAQTAWDLRRDAAALLAIIDQRLLYWPAGGLPGNEGSKVVEAWQNAMTRVRDSGGWLAGYIDRPGKRSVLTMLHSLNAGRPGFDIGELYSAARFSGLTDADLFDEILAPGERSPVFVDISQHNNTFRERDGRNEVCFFYLKTGPNPRQVARVDVPMWVAEEETAVAAVHALIYDQCRILGYYPYVITRADEIAVVGHRDKEELENRIALRLADAGIAAAETSKQQAKGLARSGRTRHGGV